MSPRRKDGCCRWTVPAAAPRLADLFFDANAEVEGILEQAKAQGTDKMASLYVIDVVARKNPAALFVVTAPVTEVNQDDAEGVIDRVDYPNTLVVRPASP